MYKFFSQFPTRKLGLGFSYYWGSTHPGGKSQKLKGWPLGIGRSLSLYFLHWLGEIALLGAMHCGFPQEFFCTFCMRRNKTTFDYLFVLYFCL